MHMTVGDRIVVETQRVARPRRTGVIDQILHHDPPRYRVNWDNGRTTILAPGSGGATAGSAVSRASMSTPNLGRSVNERIRLLEDGWTGEHDFVCECEDDRCTQVMHMNTKEYEAIRTDPMYFAVLPGHEETQRDHVLARTDRYVAVKKNVPVQGTAG
jgi:hypothetical protein